jgi:hypothetical protein
METQWSIDTGGADGLVRAYVTMENPAIPTSVADDYLSAGGYPVSDAGIRISRPETAFGRQSG